MKDKILVFIIGLLVGAIITVSVFLIIEKNNKNFDQMPGREDMQMMDRPDEKMEQGRFEEKNIEERPDERTKQDKTDLKEKDENKQETKNKEV